MMNLQKRLLLMGMTGITMSVFGMVDAYTQTRPTSITRPSSVESSEGSERLERTLSGKIRWKKSMGVLPKGPGSSQPAENICAQFYVAVNESTASSNELVAYDAALKAVTSVEPGYYVCNYEMKVPTNRNLVVTPGMGDVFRAAKPDRKPFHFADAWVAEDGTRPVPPSGFVRAISPPFRPVVLDKKNMYVGYEIFYNRK